MVNRASRKMHRRRSNRSSHCNAVVTTVACEHRCDIQTAERIVRARSLESGLRLQTRFALRHAARCKSSTVRRQNCELQSNEIPGLCNSGPRGGGKMRHGFGASPRPRRRYVVQRATMMPASSNRPKSRFALKIRRQLAGSEKFTRATCQAACAAAAHRPTQ